MPGADGWGDVGSYEEVEISCAFCMKGALLSHSEGVQVAIGVPMVEYAVGDAARTLEVRSCTLIQETEELFACLCIKEYKRGSRSYL